MMLKTGTKVVFLSISVSLPNLGHNHNFYNTGNRLMAVLMHQIGHLFGLDHSSNPSSIMSPLFHFDSEKLLDEDIKNLRMILGLETSNFSPLN